MSRGSFIDRLIGLHLEGKLDAATAVDGEVLGRPTSQCKIVDDCLQLFGGYGYMNEYPIARMFRDTPRAANLWRHQRDHEGADRANAVRAAAAYRPERRSPLTNKGRTA